METSEESYQSQLCLQTFDAFLLAENVWKAIHTDSPNERRDPKREHPIFYGCYDWHSAVHSHCTLILLLDIIMEQQSNTRMTDVQEFREKVLPYFQESFTSANVEVERQTLLIRPLTWECPYGFVWFLKLVTTCQKRSDFRPFLSILMPLFDAILERLIIWIKHDFADSEWPHRSGWHANTAFALKMIQEVLTSGPEGEGLDFADEIWSESTLTHLKVLQESLVQSAMCLFRNDFQLQDKQEKCPFLSPTLCEANLMTQCLSTTQHSDEIGGNQLEKWLQTAICPEVWDMLPNNEGNPQDGYASHLCGLNFSRSYDLACIAECLPRNERNKGLASKLLKSAVEHYNHSVSTLASGHFMGDHWLASFAVRAKQKLDQLL